MSRSYTVDASIEVFRGQQEDAVPIAMSDVVALHASTSGLDALLYADLEKDVRVTLRINLPDLKWLTRQISAAAEDIAPLDRNYARSPKAG